MNWTAVAAIAGLLLGAGTLINSIVSVMALAQSRWNGRQAVVIATKVEEVHKLTNGNIAVIQKLADKGADQRIALAAAETMKPENIAVAAELVKVHAEAAKEG